MLYQLSQQQEEECSYFQMLIANSEILLVETELFGSQLHSIRFIRHFNLQPNLHLFPMGQESLLFSYNFYSQSHRFNPYHIPYKSWSDCYIKVFISDIQEDILLDYLDL